MKMKSFKMYALPLFVVSVYLFLYVPIIILILFSFNKSSLTYQWGGFSLVWYKTLFQSVEVWHALQNSLIVAGASVFLSLAMGLLLVFNKSQWASKFMFLFYGLLAAPEIVLAVGLLGIFSLYSIPFGLTTLIAGHTLIGLGYVVPIIHARFVELEYHLTEAALDLGATQTQTFFTIILPLLSPALLASALLVFIVSLDDFIIAFFCSGATTQTLPLYIFSVIRTGATPLVNALSVLLLCVSSLIVIIFATLNVKKSFL